MAAQEMTEERRIEDINLQMVTEILKDTPDSNRVNIKITDKKLDMIDHINKLEIKKDNKNAPAPYSKFE